MPMVNCPQCGEPRPLSDGVCPQCDVPLPDGAASQSEHFGEWAAALPEASLIPATPPEGSQPQSSELRPRRPRASAQTNAASQQEQRSIPRLLSKGPFATGFLLGLGFICAALMTAAVVALVAYLASAAFTKASTPTQTVTIVTPTPSPG